jgi:hypothetical protein
MPRAREFGYDKRVFALLVAEAGNLQIARRRAAQGVAPPLLPVLLTDVASAAIHGRCGQALRCAALRTERRTLVLCRSQEGFAICVDPAAFIRKRFPTPRQSLRASG